MKVYFCGQFIKDDIANNYFESLKGQFSLAGNVFYNALLEGFAENGFKVITTSFVPRSIYKDCLKYKDDKISIKYRVRPRIQIFKNIIEFFQTFRNVRLLRNDRNNNYAVFNVLRISQSLGGLLACWIHKIPSIGVVTDVPGYRIKSESSYKVLTRLTDWLGQHMVCHFDYYILLADEMSKILHINADKYSLVEGIYKGTFGKKMQNRRDTEYTILYAGSLQKQYGIINLVSAIHMIEDDRIRLVIYGSGEAINSIKEISKKDCRIQYCGMLSHEEILKKESEVSLLVNPRPVDDEYVKYSFPSKNMEYMASGTPVLLTKIPSLPQEYCQYVNLIKTNSVFDIVNGIRIIINDYISALKKAEQAQKFILDNKTPYKQINKVLSDLARNRGNKKC